MRKVLRAFKRDERGVSAIEYAILAGIIVVVVASAVVGFDDQIGEDVSLKTGTEMKFRRFWAALAHENILVYTVVLDSSIDENIKQQMKSCA